MTIGKISVTAALLLCAGCGNFGQVEQGRVIAYDRQAGTVTLIREAAPRDNGAGVLPPLTIRVPADPQEMGPEPAAGKLMLVDSRRRRLVVFDSAAQAFRTIGYTPLAERRHAGKAPAGPRIDRAARTITVYAAPEQLLITFAASAELLALPPDTWICGDVVRYYYKQPDQALRLMNVTRTDLSKS